MAPGVVWELLSTRRRARAAPRRGQLNGPTAARRPLPPRPRHPHAGTLTYNPDDAAVRHQHNNARWHKSVHVSWMCECLRCSSPVALHPRPSTSGPLTWSPSEVVLRHGCLEAALPPLPYFGSSSAIVPHYLWPLACPSSVAESTDVHCFLIT